MKTLSFHVEGQERKTLVDTVSALTNNRAVYHPGKPKFAFEVGPYTIDCRGTMEVADSVSTEELRRLLIQLAAVGFIPDESNEGTAETEEAGTASYLPMIIPQETEAPQAIVTIKMPRDGFTEADLDKLRQIIRSKHTLLKKALGTTDDLIIGETDEAISFGWIPADAGAERCQATMHLIEKLCHMAKTVKRVNATEHAVTNEKYSFRCFLLRLGFIGPKYKADRKVLLHNFTGSAAFKNGKAKKDLQIEQSAYEA